MRVLIAAGGTAGHINPGLAIADKVMEVFPESEILFVGTPWGMESKLVPRADYEFVSIKMSGIQRSLTFKNIVRNVEAVYYYSTAKTNAKKLIKRFNPDIVVGTGGYVSAPILRSAAKLGIPTVSHESNSYAGVATKMLSKYVDRVFVADENALQSIPHKENCVITGNPIRSMAKVLPREQARQELGLPEGLTILSFGGSLGANVISEAVAELLKWENAEGGINHIHAYGKNGREDFHELLKQKGVVVDEKRMILREYINNMYTCYSAADIIISRSGAMTQTELKAIGRASIQVPWPKATENHQFHNASAMVKGGAAVLIEEKDFSPEKLIETVKMLKNQPETLQKMEESAAKMANFRAADVIVGQMIDLVR